MLDLKLIRDDPDRVREAATHKGIDAPVDEILRLDERRRTILAEGEELKHQRNTTSKEIGRLKGGGGAECLKAQVRGINDRIKLLDDDLRRVEAQLGEAMLLVPSIPHRSAPVGADESENVEIRHWGESPSFDFEPLPHWDIGERLGIIDFERGVKISGARFHVLKGLGARLERALINWMVDLHVSQHGYTEILTPFVVRSECMTGTGQLPKFGDDAYHCEIDDLWLIPTAEVPVTNLHREEILEPGTLPLYYVAYSACFRREAGAAGRDTRGVTRVHQFDKVEMVKFVEPESSYDELERLLDNAEDVLRRLELPYRVMEMCTGDLGFCATKKYDPEVWCAGQDRFVEVSSCSNFEDFQARRANVKYRPARGEKARFVHTLNGSGLAVGRTLAAVLENYQQADGSVVIPRPLHPYMGGVEVIPAS